MTITRRRKRPVEVDTVQWTGDNEAELIDFTGHRFEAVPPEDRPEDPEITAQVFDELHSTWVGVKTGQHVIRGVKGEYYPVAEDVLAETYERMDSGTTSAEQRAEAASRLGTQYMLRAEQAEAAINRVRERARQWQAAMIPGERNPAAQQILDLLDEPSPAATEATEPESSARELIAAAIYEHNNPGRPWADAHPDDRITYGGDADAALAVIQPGTRITATLARMSEADVQRVIALYERWVKAGPPPLGTAIARWWDARLAELHSAILPSGDRTQGCGPECSEMHTETGRCEIARNR